MHKPNRSILFILTLTLTPLALTGCGALDNASSPLKAGSQNVVGKVRGGQQPVSGSTITVWEMGTAGYGTDSLQLAQTTSDQDGNFSFPVGAYSCADGNAPVYITASGGNPGLAGTVNNTSIMLAAGIGTCSSAPSQTLVINEVTTAATAYALSQFFTISLGGDYTTDYFSAPSPSLGGFHVGLTNANSYTIPTLVDNGTGQAITSGGSVHTEATKLNSVANILSACVNSAGVSSAATQSPAACDTLFAYTTPPGSTTSPSDTLQAAVQMAKFPYQNVTELFDLSPATQPFVGLSSTPHDWTIAISYTNPSFGLSISEASNVSTSSSIDIDANGRVWFPTNKADSHGVAYFDPESTSFNGPFSTGLLQPQYVAIDQSGSIFATDMASGNLIGNSTSSPTAVGTPYSLPLGIGSGPLTVDTDGAVLLAYTTQTGQNLGLLEGSSVSAIATNAFVGIPTSITSASPFYAPDGRIVYAATGSASQGCAEEFASSNYGSAPISQSGGSCSSGGNVVVDGSGDDVLSIASTNNEFENDSSGTFFTPPVPVSIPEAVAIDGTGQIWIANSGDASISTLGYTFGNGTSSDYDQTSSVSYLHDASHGNTMSSPYGLAIDASGNVWVSNAGCVATSASGCTPSDFVLTELVGAAAPTITPRSAQAYFNVGVKPSLRLKAKQPEVRPKHLKRPH